MFTNLTHVYANQADRPARFLAERHTDAGDFYLYEYAMPRGTTTLVELKTCQRCQGSGTTQAGNLLVAGGYALECDERGCWGNGYKKTRTINYAAIPRYWIEAIVRAGNEYMLSFNPQQAKSKLLEQAQLRFDRIVAELYAAKGES